MRAQVNNKNTCVYACTEEHISGDGEGGNRDSCFGRAMRSVSVSVSVCVCEFVSLHLCVLVCWQK